MITHQISKSLHISRFITSNKSYNLKFSLLFLKSFKGGGKFIDRIRFTVKGGAGGMGHPKYGIKEEALKI